MLIIFFTQVYGVMDFNMVDNPRFHNKDYYPLARVICSLIWVVHLVPVYNVVLKPKNLLAQYAQ